MAPTSQRKVLIVYAHQEVTSFNHALLDTAKTTLEENGHSVKTTDLYKINFNPLIGRHDIKGKLISITYFVKHMGVFHDILINFTAHQTFLQDF